MAATSVAIAAARRALPGAEQAPARRVGAAAAENAPSACFHCGEANPAGGRWRAVWDGSEREFCCAAALGVPQPFPAAGLNNFYTRGGVSRGAPPPPPGEGKWRRP